MARWSVTLAALRLRVAAILTCCLWLPTVGLGADWAAPATDALRVPESGVPLGSRTENLAVPPIDTSSQDATHGPTPKTLDEFDFGQQPSINKPLVLELAKGQYIDNRENVLLIGSSGVGKTHLAIALGLAACGQGRKVRFFRVTELITLLMEAKEEKQLLRFRKQIKQLDLIVLDELGYVPTGKVGAELLFDVLSTAYERQSLIVTTNLPFEQWTEVLGSERLTGAALDRLTHRCHILEAKGESFRLRDARRRQRRAAGTA